MTSSGIFIAVWIIEVQT